MAEKGEPFKIDSDILIDKLHQSVGKTLGQVDYNNVFAKTIKNPKITGIAGDVIEQSVIGYPPDSKQRPDLLVDGVETELKTTGLIRDKDNNYIPKEPVTITAVSIDKIASQTYENSFFWHKVHHLLFVYYEYKRLPGIRVIPAGGYANFPILGFQFYEFNDLDKQRLKNDWQLVRDYIADLQANYSPEQLEVMYRYIHHNLKRNLMLIDISPRYPFKPRFRFKKDLMKKVINQHFQQQLEQLPVQYSKFSEIDSKCHELAALYVGKTIEEIINMLGLEKPSTINKALAETIIIRMFDGKSKNFVDVDLFNSIGLIGKTITFNNKGGKTEDTKMFKIDFDELMPETGVSFGESSFCDYFNHQFLFMCLEEPYKEAPLLQCKFLGFKRVIFDTPRFNRQLIYLFNLIKVIIATDELRNVPVLDKYGNVRYTPKTNKPMEAPNFPKSVNSPIFVRGSGSNASKKPLCINGVEMYSQYVWLSGTFLSKFLADWNYL